MDREAAAKAVQELLRALGKEPEGELSATPKLVAEAWCDDLLAGEAADPREILQQAALPAEDARGMVTLRDLAVTSVCPHHLMPSHGSADIVYFPGDELVGFGAIARALHACTRRLTLQEKATAQMAKLLVDAAGARGALCRLRLTHTCLVARGVREQSAIVETVAAEGVIASEGKERDLALAVLAGTELETED